MKLRTIDDVENFRKVLDECNGAVWLASINGDIFDLKSSFSRYIAIGELIADKNEELELFCANREDEAKLLEFVSKLYE